MNNNKSLSALYVVGIIAVLLFIPCGFLGIIYRFFYLVFFGITVVAFGTVYLSFQEKDFDKWCFVLDIFMFLAMIPISYTVITVSKFIAVNVIFAVLSSFYALGFIYKVIKSIKCLITKKLVKQVE